MCVSVCVADGSPTHPQSKGADKRSKRGRPSRKHFTPFDTEDHIQYWVPRIHLSFAAEDPRVFAERLSRAYHLRKVTEAYLRYICTCVSGSVYACTRTYLSCVCMCLCVSGAEPPLLSPRYNLYVDCMPVEGVSEMDAAQVDRIVGLSRSLTRLRTDRWAQLGGEGDRGCATI